MTIAELDKLYANQNERKKDADDRIASAKKRIDDLTEQATKAALEGELEQYKGFSARIKEEKDELFVLEKFRESLETKAPIVETHNAWADYAAVFNRKFAAKYKQFEKAKKEFLNLYGELLQAQNEAFVIRDRLTGYCGKEVKRGLLSELEAENPIELLPSDYKPVERALLQGNDDLLFYAANMCEREKQNSAFDIVHNHVKSNL